jgi:hypothetical protein
VLGFPDGEVPLVDTLLPKVSSGFEWALDQSS